MVILSDDIIYSILCFTKDKKYCFINSQFYEKTKQLFQSRNWFIYDFCRINFIRTYMNLLLNGDEYSTDLKNLNSLNIMQKYHCFKHTTITLKECNHLKEVDYIFEV